MTMLHMWHVSNFRNGPAHNADAANAAASARDAQTTASDVELRLDKLMLITMAMWELLRDNTKFTEADLLAKVQELDLRDGIPDGKITQSVRKCPQCGRTMSPRHKKCLYCGYESLVDSVFDGL
jgi:ribosomal protein S27AE